ncbi:MAG: hypothetical protein ACTSRW_00405 [Candidatus Helarchaeota archaeon]
MSGYKNLIKNIPDEAREKFVEKLLDVVLESNHKSKIPQPIVNQTFRLMNHDLLDSDYGVELLLKQGLMCEPEQTMALIADTVSLQMVFSELKAIQSELKVKLPIMQ